MLADGVDQVPAGALVQVDPVQVVIHQEIQLHLHLGLPLVDEGVILARAGLAPQRPGDGIQKSRLAVAVGPRQAGDVDTLEVKRGHIVAVAQEVAHLQADWDHGTPRGLN